jgi:hypothetical protein
LTYGSKPLKARAEDGMRVDKGHKEATEFLKVDIKTKLLPSLLEQLCSTQSRDASSRAEAEARGVRLKAKYSDLGTNGNHSRGECDGRDVDRRAVQHKSLGFCRIMFHGVRQKPFVAFAKPGINLISACEVARESRGRSIGIN